MCMNYLELGQKEQNLQKKTVDKNSIILDIFTVFIYI